jgi:energy-coupling factor transport system ATP-binding protein
LQAVIRQLTATGKTVIVISHDMDFVAENLNRAICLEAGKVCYDGPMADLFDDAFILELCCLIPPQIAQLAAACDVTPKTITPRGLIDCLLRSRTSRQTHQSAASETRHD